MTTSLMRRNRIGTLNPWRLFDELERQMWDWVSTPWDFMPHNRFFSESRSYVPPVDIYETDDHVLVAASLPGVDPSDLKVEVRNTTVTISGEQKPIVDSEQETAYTEHLSGIRRYGKFSFTFSLPCEVEQEKAQAKYQNGILRLMFPKLASARPLRIPIQGTESLQIEGEGGKPRKK